MGPRHTQNVAGSHRLDAGGNLTVGCEPFLGSLLNSYHSKAA